MRHLTGLAVLLFCVLLVAGCCGEKYHTHKCEGKCSKSCSEEKCGDCDGDCKGSCEGVEGCNCEGDGKCSCEGEKGCNCEGDCKCSGEAEKSEPCSMCGLGEDPATGWCDQCNFGYVNGVKVTCKKSYEAKLAGCSGSCGGCAK